MTSMTRLALVAGFASVLAGCGEENNLVPTIRRGPDGAYAPPPGANARDAYRPPQETVDQSQQPPLQPTPGPESAPAPTPVPAPADTPAPASGSGLRPPAPADDSANAPALSSERVPFGLKVLGRPDLVTSPYKPEAGPISIQDDSTGKPYPRGTEVRCPWTQKTFKVP